LQTRVSDRITRKLIRCPLDMMFDRLPEVFIAKVTFHRCGLRLQPMINAAAFNAQRFHKAPKLSIGLSNGISQRLAPAHSLHFSSNSGIECCAKFTPSNHFEITSLTFNPAGITIDQSRNMDIRRPIIDRKQRISLMRCSDDEKSGGCIVSLWLRN
jgi:hypothetical protein